MVWVSVEVDLSEIDTYELIEELELRGQEILESDHLTIAKILVEKYRTCQPGWLDDILDFVHDIAGKVVVK